MTRIISAVFRKGGDITFLVEELRSVFDPAGGYWKKGGQYMPSLVAEIGDVIERHLIKIGILEHPNLNSRQLALIEQQRNQFQLNPSPSETHPDASLDYPDEATLCPACGTLAVILLGQGKSCLHCGLAEADG